MSLLAFRKKADDFLLTCGPVTILKSELKKICVEIKNSGVSKNGNDTSVPIKYDLGDVGLFKMYHRRGEGTKSIFANVLVNQPIKHAGPSEPGEPSTSNQQQGKSNSKNLRVLQRQSSSREPSTSRRRSRTPSSGRYGRSRSRSKSHRRSRSRRRSHSSGKRSPRKLSPPSRRYSSPRRKRSISRGRRSPSAGTSRREHEADRYRRREHFSRGRTPDRPSKSRRHYSPSKTELPMLMPTMPVDPALAGYYPMPFAHPEYYMGWGMQPGMFRPRLPPHGFIPRPPMRHRFPIQYNTKSTVTSTVETPPMTKPATTPVTKASTPPVESTPSSSK